MRLLAIDPALRNTGYAVLEQDVRRSLRAVDFGVIRNPAPLLHSACLARLRTEVARLIEAHHPGACAVEGIIYVQSFRTAITLGAARAAALIAAADAGLPIHEYAPRRVKQAVVGRGGAEKVQVAFMVRALLGLTSNPEPDAADALAIGIAHFQASAVRRETGRI